MSLILEPMDRSNWRRCLEVCAKPEQMRFVADFEPVALVILAKCFVRPQDRKWLPFAILSENQIIGIFALAVSASCCELYHFLIDRSVQRRGYGRTALLHIIEHVRNQYPDCQQLNLTVHEHNTAAQSLYRSTGFEETAEINNGEKVWRLTLSN